MFLDTVAFLKKEGVTIKCLCDYSALHGKLETKVDSFATFKCEVAAFLSESLSIVNDLNIE